MGRFRQDSRTNPDISDLYVLSWNAGSLAGGVDSLTLTATRGLGYIVSLLFLGAFGFLTAVDTVGAVVNGWSAPYEGILAIFATVDALGILSVWYYRSEQRLTVDDEGVRRARGSKVRQRFSWSEIRKVEYGQRPNAVRRGMVSFVRVSGPLARRSIDFDGDAFKVDPSSVTQFVEQVAQKASERGIATRRSGTKTSRRDQATPPVFP
jgi:hypothetical protein